jgi:toxin ParE1/3/4
MEIVWLPKALENLKEIKQYIANDSSKSAKKVAEKIKNTVATIRNYPHIGSPSLVNGFREMQVVGLPFVVFYKVFENKIVIARVLHNRQDFFNLPPKS